MNEPDDKTGQEAQSSSLSAEVARQVVSWGKTIGRWSNDGEQCFLVTEFGLRSVTLEDVAMAEQRLRRRRPYPPDC